jgi:imidazoleglycerol phosphate synthase glutamine amidotransferase subunit HisH
VLPGRVGRFADGVRVPQFGWNRVVPEPGCRLVEPGYAYFANSYRVLEAPGCAVATAEHGGRFIAALERAGVLACQFHPELSGAYGHDLIARWLDA